MKSLVSGESMELPKYLGPGYNIFEIQKKYNKWQVLREYGISELHGVQITKALLYCNFKGVFD